MSLSSRSLWLAATASLATAQPQSPHHDHVTLQDLVVTAHPYARARADLAQPTNVLAGRSLDLRQAPTLGELLAQEPGISSTSFAPGSSRPIIRGLGGDRLRVLTNGIGTIDASVTSPDHAVALDPLLIERVEVVRGPASLWYGSSAVGGVVNVITHRIHATSPESPLTGRIEGRLGSVNEERSAGAVLEGGVGPFAWHLDGFRRSTGDVRIPGYAESARRRAEEAEEHAGEEADDEEVARGRIPNTAISSDGGALGFSYLGSRGYVGVAYSGFNSFYGLPAGGHAHAEEEHKALLKAEAEDEHADEGVRVDLRQRRVDVEGEWREPFAGSRALRFKLSRAQYQHRELEGAEVGTVFQNRGYEGRLEWLHEPIGPFSGAAGVQFSRTTLRAEGEEAFLPPSRSEQQALFVLEEARLGAVTWQVGARVEHQDLTVLEETPNRERHDRAFSVSTGVLWPINETWSLASSLTRTQRPPNAQELYSDGPHAGTAAYERGDDALARERSVGLDVALRRRTGWVTGSATVFANRFDGFIFTAPTGEEEDHLPVYAYRQRDAQFVGAEAEAVLHLHEADDNVLDLTLAADLVRARNRSDDEHLPRITPPRARVGLEWRNRTWSAGADAQHVLEQTRLAPEEAPTASYTLLGAYLGWRWVGGTTTLDVLLRGTNLADREARMHTSYLKEIAPLPGRNLTLAARLSF